MTAVVGGLLGLDAAGAGTVPQSAGAAAPVGGTVAVAVRKPDGYSQAGIYVIGGRGTGGRMLRRRGGGPTLSWSPDGRRLLFREARGTFGPFLLRVTDRTGRRVRTIWKIRGTNTQLGDASWAPDSARLVYWRDVKERVAGRSVRNRWLYITGADGRGQRLLVLREAGKPTWQYERNVWYFDRPAWSPDGSTLAIPASRWDGRCFGSSCDPGFGTERLRNGVWLANPETGEARQVFSGRGVGDLAWSPDGERLAFSTPRQVYVFDAATGIVTRPAKGDMPTWSPDGRRLAFVRAGDVRVVRTDGTGERDLVPGRSGRRTVDSRPQWSPDGRRIGFVRTQLQPRRAAVTSEHVYLAPAAGGTARRLTNLPNHEPAFAWTHR
jgi:Tol biopolymer transport system component